MNRNSQYTSGNEAKMQGGRVEYCQETHNNIQVAVRLRCREAEMQGGRVEYCQETHNNIQVAVRLKCREVELNICLSGLEPISAMV